MYNRICGPGNLTRDKTISYVLAGESLFSLSFSTIVSIKLSRTLLSVPTAVAGGLGGGLAFTAYNLLFAGDWAASTFGR